MKNNPTYKELEQQILELKNKNEILRLQEYSVVKEAQKYSNMFRQAPLAYQTLDSEGHFLTVNDNWLKIFGYDNDEVIGKWFGDFFAPEYVESFQKCFSKFKTQEEIHFEFEMLHKTGERRFITLDGRINNDSNGEFLNTHCVLQDETKSKQAEKALMESEEKLKLLITLSSDLLHLQDLESIYKFIVENLQKRYVDTNILYVSIDERNKKARLETISGFNNKLLKKITKISGFNPVGKEYNLLEALSNKFRSGDLLEFHGGLDEFSGPEFPTLAAKALEKLIGLHKIYTIGITKDNKLLGAIHFFTFNNKNITDKSFIEAFVGHAGIALQKKMAEIALRESEANLKAIIENSIESIWSIDTNYQIQYVNEVFVKAFEYSFGVVLSKGVNIIESLPKSLRPMWKERYERAFNKEQFIFLDKIGIGDSAVYIEVAMNPILVDGKVVGASFYGKDISKQKKYEIQLIAAKERTEESETRFKALHNASFGGISIHDKGIILECNQGLSDMTGYSVDELIGMNGLLLLAEQSRDLVMHNILSGNEKPYEVVGVHKNGKEIPLRIESRIIPYKGKMVRTVELRDITEQKKAELDIIQAKERAEESDQLKSAFLANMSHEIRTPMNGILGFSELLKNPQLTADEQQEYIDIIKKSGERLLNIINDIINISKIESGQMEVNMQNVDINEQMEDIYSFFKPEAEGKELQFSFKNSLLSKEVVLKTDQEKVYATLTNLVKNAIKFCKEGAIELGYIQRGDFLEFYVKDTGIGIPINIQNAIFERFRQADIEGRDAYQGAGLGLSISKAYVEMLGGKIWVESEVDKGSTFYFTHPYPSKLVHGNGGKNIMAPPLDEPSIKKSKILIVEDDELSEKLIAISVQKFGGEIMSVKTGTDAVKACFNNPDIDLVMMDIQMPEMDGYQATKEIRRFNKDVIVIAQTAYALEGDKEKALAAGCNDYISKPIKADRLKQIMTKYLITE